MESVEKDWEGVEHKMRSDLNMDEKAKWKCKSQNYWERGKESKRDKTIICEQKQRNSQQCEKTDVHTLLYSYSITTKC